MNADDRFEPLWTDFLEGDLDAEGQAELRGLLAADERLQQHAADAFQTHRLLGFIAQTDAADAFVAATMAKLPVGREQFVQRLMQRVQPPVETAGSARGSWRWAAAGLAAAACVALLLNWAGWISFSQTHAAIATLILAEDAVWSGSQTFQEGQRLTAGSMMLERGTAVLRFDGGASVLLHAGCELELESRGRARLRRGAVVVRAPEEAAGFVLRTPAREVVDLGTEFSASVEASGATEVRVLEGEVALHERAHRAAGGKVLGAGESVRFANADAAPSPAGEQVTPRFDESVRATIGRSSAEPPRVFEGFDYAPGDYTPSALSGGNGWAGPWRLRTEADGGRAYSGTTRTMLIGEGRTLRAPAGKSFRLRPLAAPVRMGRDDVTYLSLRFDEPPLTPDDAGRQSRGVSLGFRNSRDFDREHVTLRVNQILRPVIETGSGQGFGSRVRLQPGQQMLLVAKILSRRDGEDEVSLRVYPANESPEPMEPAEWDVTSHGLRRSADLDLLMLQSTGPAPRDIFELRIGPTWRSIVPPDTQLTKSE